MLQSYKTLEEVALRGLRSLYTAPKDVYLVHCLFLFRPFLKFLSNLF